MGIRIGGITTLVPALAGNPMAGRLRRAQCAGLLFSLPLGLLLAPESAHEMLLISMLVFGIILIYILVAVPLFLAVQGWTPDCVDGRRWCRAHAVMLVAYTQFGVVTACRLAAYLVTRAGVWSPAAMALTALGLLAFVLQNGYAGQRNLGRYIWMAQDWNARRDTLAAAPEHFAPVFRDLRRFPEHAVAVLHAAAPAQLAALRPDDVLPLLTSTVPSVRSGALTALSGLVAEYRRAA